jgi:hypothetical protein
MMLIHRYPCGQHVTFIDKRYLGPSWTGGFIIVKQLPSGEEAPRYEIKSLGETYSRVAYEDQLSASLSIFK